MTMRLRSNCGGSFGTVSVGKAEAVPFWSNGLLVLSERRVKVWFLRRNERA